MQAIAKADRVIAPVCARINTVSDVAHGALADGTKL
jgi:hypothetical protein